mmetsp:Transcript_72140/g.167183  ORF Transcript_72140/g.167183 Transcript_72140/m.167183 type:complete len:258 (+) Transcript_72140:160-933(+)
MLGFCHVLQSKRIGKVQKPHSRPCVLGVGDQAVALESDTCNGASGLSCLQAMWAARRDSPTASLELRPVSSPGHVAKPSPSLSSSGGLCQFPTLTAFSARFAPTTAWTVTLSLRCCKCSSLSWLVAILVAVSMLAPDSPMYLVTVVVLNPSLRCHLLGASLELSCGVKVRLRAGLEAGTEAAIESIVSSAGNVVFMLISVKSWDVSVAAFRMGGTGSGSSMTRLLGFALKMASAMKMHAKPTPNIAHPNLDMSLYSW